MQTLKKVWRGEVSHLCHPMAVSLFVFAGEAVILYNLLADGTLDLYHTEVPPALRGQGIAGQLAEVK